MYSKEQAFDPVSRPTTAAASSGADPAAAEVERLAKDLRTDGERILRGLKRVGYVEWKRLNLRAVDIGFRVGLFALGGALALTLAITATVFLVSGIRGAFLAGIGSAWVADLLTGVVVLGAIAGAFFAVQARVRAQLLVSTKRAIAAMGDPIVGDPSLRESDAANQDAAHPTAKAGPR
jgi:hypothetical protein